MEKRWRTLCLILPDPTDPVFLTKLLSCKSPWRSGIKYYLTGIRVINKAVFKQRGSSLSQSVCLLFAASCTAQVQRVQRAGFSLHAVKLEQSNSIFCNTVTQQSADLKLCAQRRNWWTDLHSNIDITLLLHKKTRARNTNCP